MFSQAQCFNQYVKAYKEDNEENVFIIMISESFVTYSWQFKPSLRDFQ
jgi:hypothetical protein